MLLFPKIVSDYLTENSNYYLNWSRVGNLVFTNHRYSKEELLPRAFIITSMALGGFLGAHLVEENKGYSCALGLSLGFIVSHALVVLPLMRKRREFESDCNKLIEELNTQLEVESAFKQETTELINKIMNHDDKKNASAVWGKRLRLMQTLKDWIDNKNHDELSAIFKQPDIISFLDKNNAPLAVISIPS